MIYVALDVGNVLVHSNFDDFIRKLSKALNITLEEATYFMNRTQKLHDLGLTNMSDELRDHFKIKSPVTMEELISHWNDVIVPSGHIIDLLNDLSKDHKIKVALLSNVGLEHSTRMGEVLSQGTFFENAIKFFSCNVGARKPSLLYYHLFLELHPEFEGCVYVDDLQENLEAAQQFKSRIGKTPKFNTFHFSLQDAVKSKEEKAKMKELKKLLIESNTDLLPNPRWH
jgi:FMN phosphatase YigB (HAD superfamily)